MNTSPISIARALHAALEAGLHGEALRPFFTADAVTIERPNALKATGATSDLEAMLTASTAGAGLLARQSYAVVSAVEQDALAIMRVTWTGEIARDVGPFRRGQVLTAHVAQFIETRDGRVARIETYDCYEPFRTPIIAHALSEDGSRIAYERTGSAPTALVFVHGWLGSRRWWDAQREAFAPRYTVVQLDLAGHGASDRDRMHHSAEAYASDITAVVDAVGAKRVVLVGHSMSGAYTLLAALRLPTVAALVLVDTLANVEQMPPAAQVQEMLALYRRDFRGAVERVLPGRLFAPTTPREVSARLEREFLERTGEDGATLLEPLYRVDLAAAADRLAVPVRAIQSDLQPTNVDANRRHFRDYAMRVIPGVGHYPMLEAPAAFNAALAATLVELGLG